MPTADKPRFVAGVLGPTNRTASLSPDVNDPGFRNIGFDELVDTYYEATRGLVDGGADILLIETIFDTLNAKAAVFAIEQYFEDTGSELPVMISGTITDASRPHAVRPDRRGVLEFAAPRAAAVDRLQLRAGREAAAPVRRGTGRAWPTAASAPTPTPACPTSSANTTKRREAMAEEIGEWAQTGFLNIVGGCCGTTPAHIQAIAEAVAKHRAAQDSRDIEPHAAACRG